MLLTRTIKTKLYTTKLRNPSSKVNITIPKKVREKSRECHNHKPQPFPDPKRKRKPTNLNKYKPNKRTNRTSLMCQMCIFLISFSSVVWLNSIKSETTTLKFRIPYLHVLHIVHQLHTICHAPRNLRNKRCLIRARNSIHLRTHQPDPRCS